MLHAAGLLGLGGVVPSALASPARFAGTPAVQAVIDDWVASRRLPGAIVSLERGAAPPDYVAGGTLAFDSPVKVDEHSIWRMASLTKPVAGMAGMLLIGEGKLQLDQPVADFLPAYANLRVIPDPNRSDSRPAARPLTIRHLLTHTSGFRNDPSGTIAEAYRRLGVLPSSASVSSAAAEAMPPPRNLAEWADRMAQVPLAAEPGTKWLYSPNLDVLARVIELVSGLDFDVFLERRMFAPLGMRSTGFWVREADKARLVTRYEQRDGQLVAIDRGATSSLLERPRIPRASGGLVSTAHDYDRFMAMLINGGRLERARVIPRKAVALGLSNLLPPGTDMSEYTSRTGHDGFGAGGMVTTGGLRPGTYGWGGSSGTSAFMNPRFGTRWAVYTNIGTSRFGSTVTAAAGMTFVQTPGNPVHAPPKP